MPLLTITAWTSQRGRTSKAELENRVASGPFNLSAFPDQVGAITSELGLPADAQVRLTITSDWAGGRAVCNEYGGIVAAGPAGAWRISELGFTEMLCAGAESDYFDMFGATTSWSLAGSVLVLEGPDGALRYAPG